MLSHSPPTVEPAAPAQTRARPVLARVQGPIRIPAQRRRAVYTVLSAIWLTGVLWLSFHYFGRTAGEFGPEPSPLEPWWLKLHGAAAFASLWMLGLLWGVHIVNGWRARRRRWSGGALFGVAIVLIGTGYLLYYGGDDRLRDVTSVVHWALGLAAPVVFLIHRYFARNVAERRASASGGKLAAHHDQN